MKDENKVLEVMKKFKWIIVIILALVTCITIISIILNKNNKNNLETYLKNNGYKNTSGLYTKTINKNNNNNNERTSISYGFSIDANKFTKNIDKGSYTTRETITLQYNGTKIIKIFYSGNNYEDNSSISQNATYNIDNDNFKCELEAKKSNYPTQCNKIKKQAKYFSNEIKKILKEAHINELFATKNSDKW